MRLPSQMCPHLVPFTAVGQAGEGRWERLTFASVYAIQNRLFGWKQDWMEAESDVPNRPHPRVPASSPRYNPR